MTTSELEPDPALLAAMIPPQGGAVTDSEREPALPIAWCGTPVCPWYEQLVLTTAPDERCPACGAPLLAVERPP